MECSCIKCKRVISNKGINTHFLRAHLGVIFPKPKKVNLKCEMCDKIFTTHLNLGRHKNRSHFKKQQRIINCNCEICGKEFTSTQGLAGHKNRVHNKEFQQRNFEKGRKRYKEMLDSGEIIPHKHSAETKEKLSIKACERLAKHSKYTKNIEYKPGIILESSYEVRVAEILDELNIEWIKVRKGYVWDDNGTRRRYIPDFYLPKQNIFLDPKNDYLIKKDQRKIKSAEQLNNIKVIVLSNDVINKEFLELMLL